MTPPAFAIVGLPELVEPIRRAGHELVCPETDPPSVAAAVRAVEDRPCVVIAAGADPATRTWASVQVRKGRRVLWLTSPGLGEPEPLAGTRSMSLPATVGEVLGAFGAPVADGPVGDATVEADGTVTWPGLAEPAGQVDPASGLDSVFAPDRPPADPWDDPPPVAQATPDAQRSISGAPVGAPAPQTPQTGISSSDPFSSPPGGTDGPLSESTLAPASGDPFDGPDPAPPTAPPPDDPFAGSNLPPDDPFAGSDLPVLTSPPEQYRTPQDDPFAGSDLPVLTSPPEQYRTPQDDPFASLGQTTPPPANAASADPFGPAGTAPADPFADLGQTAPAPAHTAPVVPSGPAPRPQDRTPTDSPAVGPELVPPAPSGNGQASPNGLVRSDYSDVSAGLAPSEPSRVEELVDDLFNAAGQPAGRNPNPTRQAPVVVVVVAAKGGVSKSTLTLLLGQVAARAGLRAVVVDANRGQGDLRKYLRIPPGKAPSVLDAALSGDPKRAIIQPSTLDTLRGAALPPVGHAAVLAPTAEQADPNIVTVGVYRQVIDLARSVADIVIVDTQIAEAADTAGIHDHLVIPLLAAGNWAAGVADDSRTGLGNLLTWIDHRGERLGDARWLFTFSRISPSSPLDIELASKLVAKYGALTGIVHEDPAIKAASATGAPIVNEEMIAVANEILWRVTGVESLDPARSAKPAKKKDRKGLFGRGRR